MVGESAAGGVGNGGGAPADADPHARPRRYLTADLPGTGGRIKERPEDFLVDEVPAYDPSGQGEHIYLLVQKTGLSTFEMVTRIARHFGVDRSAVGYAGLKDKLAVTRQVVSVHAPGKTAEDFPMLRDEHLQVLWTDLHTNKLRPGHLVGNRFSIRVRGVDVRAVLAAKAVLERLGREGVPNRVGVQRFGLLGTNHLIGRALIVRDYEGAVRLLLGPDAAHPGVNAEGRALFAAGKLREALAAFPRTAHAERGVLRALAHGLAPKRAVFAMDRTVMRFYISAFQSAVFNAVMEGRLGAGTLGALVPGDLAFRHGNGSVFAVSDAVAADPETRVRLARLEISPSGPMWSGEMLRASGAVDAAERAALERFGVPMEDLSRYTERSPGMIEGARRPLRVPLIDPEVEAGVDEHGAYVRCAFELPRGSFATAVMQEVMKTEGGEEEEERGGGEVKG